MAAGEPRGTESQVPVKEAVDEVGREVMRLAGKTEPGEIVLFTKRSKSS